MSARRLVAAAVVVAIAALVAPAALTPGLNAADFIVIVAPIVLVAIVAHPGRVRPRKRSTWIAHIDASHPNAISRLDRLDGVDAPRPPSS